ncbi:MAG: 1-acyl-sn-glycerol-3-phosphate acyltransferase [Ferruginibacter sp.]
MIRRLCLFIFKITGWKADTEIPTQTNKCIIIAAPHTSNWDFWYCMATFAIYRLPIRFTVKKEWMKFPFSLLMKPLGGIAIDRSPRGPNNVRPSFVEAMTNLFNEHEKLIIVFTPEGTRSKNAEWKTGFYHVAKAARVPICMGYVDYGKKTTGICHPFETTDYKTDMKKMMDFYQTIEAKFPEKFAIDRSVFS